MAEAAIIRQPGLAALPAELLIEICSYLCWHCRENRHPTSLGSFEAGSDRGHGGCEEPIVWSREEQSQTGLAGLSMACKALHRIAEPFLYHYFYASRDDDLYYFVRTLLQRPDLASECLEVEIGHAQRVPPKTPVPLAIEGALCDQYSQHLGNNPSTETLAGLGDVVQQEVLVSLLLQLVPRLQRFHLRLRASNTFHLWSDPSHAPLVSLKALAFSGTGHHWTGFVLDQAVPTILRAPNLEALHCYGGFMVPDGFSRWLGRETPEDPAPLSNLTELRLIDTGLTPKFLRNILRAVGPKLCKVRIRINPNIKIERPLLQIDTVIPALLPWSDTLRELSFTDGCQGFEVHPYLLGVRFLRSFRALQSLEANANFWDSDDITMYLPASLRRLRLVGQPPLGYHDIITALLGLREAFAAGQYGELERIEIDCCPEDKYNTKDKVEAIMDIATSFLSAGVYFAILDGPGDSMTGKGV